MGYQLSPFAFQHQGHGCRIRIVAADGDNLVHFVRARVLIICLEDRMTELRRRVRAAMKHHNVTRVEIKGYLFLKTPARMKIAQYNARKAVVAGDLDTAIRTFIEEKKIDLVIFDPAKKAHAPTKTTTTI